MAKQPQAIVRMLRHHKGLNSGERASFSYDEVRELVNQGFAVLDDESVTLAMLGLKEDSDDDQEEQSIDTRTHEFTVEQSVELIAKVNDLEELQVLWDGEQAHPNHEGGRKGVLQAMQARAQELKADAEKKAEEEEKAEAET